MTPEVTTGFIGEVANFLKDNWDGVLLLGFTAVQCLLCILTLFQGKIFAALMAGAVYYPAAVLLVGSMFFGESWMMLTGYVVGVSLTYSVALWGVKDESLSKPMTNGFFTVVLCLSLIFG